MIPDFLNCVLIVFFLYFRDLKGAHPCMNGWAQQTPMTFSLYIKHFWRKRKEKHKNDLGEPMVREKTAFSNRWKVQILSSCRELLEWQQLCNNTDTRAASWSSLQSAAPTVSKKWQHPFRKKQIKEHPLWTHWDLMALSVLRKREQLKSSWNFSFPTSFKSFLQYRTQE